MDGKRYFVVSDIHGFYHELMQGLKKAGFNSKNKNHILVVLGDVFDRGPDAVRVYKFLSSLPKSRCILIKGNHEKLYLDLLQKSYPQSHDFHNRTADTFCQIAGYDTDCLNGSKGFTYVDKETVDNSCNNWKKIRSKVEGHSITEWIKSDRWQNYFELDNFVFVHSFVPTNLKQSAIDEFGLRAHLFENPDYFEYDPNWRSESADWGKAVWGCPFTQYQAGLFKEDKTLVVGHWHTSDFFKNLKNIREYDHDIGPIYYSKGLIGLDGGCMYDYYFDDFIHPQNVLVIDENGVCYDQDGNKLEEPAKRPIIETVTVKEE